MGVLARRLGMEEHARAQAMPNKRPSCKRSSDVLAISPGAQSSKEYSNRLRAPSTKDSFFHSPPRTILSARLAALSRRAELELPPQKQPRTTTHPTVMPLAQCSARDVSLYRPTPKQTTGLGLIRTADDVLVVESQATSVPLHRQLPSVGSCMCSLEESLSVLSSTEEFHSAIETPPNAPDTFERNAETSRCHAPKRYRAISHLARQSSGD